LPCARSETWKRNTDRLQIDTVPSKPHSSFRCSAVSRYTDRSTFSRAIDVRMVCYQEPANFIRTRVVTLPLRSSWGHRLDAAARAYIDDAISISITARLGGNPLEQPRFVQLSNSSNAHPHRAVRGHDRRQRRMPAGKTAFPRSSAPNNSSLTPYLSIYIFRYVFRHIGHDHATQPLPRPCPMRRSWCACRP
jgi:hypothetical protein